MTFSAQDAPDFVSVKIVPVLFGPPRCVAPKRTPLRAISALLGSIPSFTTLGMKLLKRWRIDSVHNPVPEAGGVRLKAIPHPFEFWEHGPVLSPSRVVRP